MISNKHIVSLSIVGCPIYTPPIALKDDYYRKRMDMLACNRVHFKFSETRANIFIIPARQNKFSKKNIFNNAPVRRIAVAMNTNSAFTGSYTENPFWYQKFDFRQSKILRAGQPMVDFDAADKFRLYVTTMKAMNFQYDIPSISTGKFKVHYVIVFDLTSMDDATESFQ